MSGLAAQAGPAYFDAMLTYRNLSNAERRALDRFARSHDLEAPASNWPEIGSASITALIGAALLEKRGRNEEGEDTYRLTDEGSRVHDEMWRDGKVPNHPRTAPFDPSTLYD